MATASEIKKKIAKGERDMAKNKKAQQRQLLKIKKLEAKTAKISRTIDKEYKPVNKLADAASKWQSEKLPKLQEQLAKIEAKKNAPKGSKAKASKVQESPDEETSTDETSASDEE